MERSLGHFNSVLMILRHSNKLHRVYLAPIGIAALVYRELDPHHAVEYWLKRDLAHIRARTGEFSRAGVDRCVLAALIYHLQNTGNCLIFLVDMNQSQKPCCRKMRTHASWTNPRKLTPWYS